MVYLKHRKDPDDPESTRSQKGDAHRHNGVSETADAAHHRIHDPTEEICRSKDHKSSHSVYNDLRV